MNPLSDVPAPTPRACSWQTFRLGLADWWRERRTPAPRSGAPRAERWRPRALQALMLAGFLLAAPVIAAFLAPLAARSLSLAGPGAVAATSMGLTLVLGLTMLLGVPVYVSWRMMRFCYAMCDRGHELLSGQRAPVPNP